MRKAADVASLVHTCLVYTVLGATKRLPLRLSMLPVCIRWWCMCNSMCHDVN